MKSNDIYIYFLNFKFIFTNSFGDPCPKYDKYDMY
jgi:hypothetical protein